MVRAGKLREKITFQEPIRVSNDSGGYTTTYSDVLDTFAAVEEVSSNPYLIANQENIDNLVRITIRYRPVLPIENGYRAVWRGFNFTVNNIKVDPMRTKIEIMVHSDMETSDRNLNEET